METHPSILRWLFPTSISLAGYQVRGERLPLPNSDQRSPCKTDFGHNFRYLAIHSEAPQRGWSFEMCKAALGSADQELPAVLGGISRHPET
jgi:hypothetical protein